MKNYQSPQPQAVKHKNKKDKIKKEKKLDKKLKDTFPPSDSTTEY